MSGLEKGCLEAHENHYDAVHQEVARVIEEQKNAYNGWREQRFRELKDLALEADLLSDQRRKRRTG